MRWLVEVTSLGKTEKDALHVDADSWQKALQLARGLRGEGEPMAGFSIELLEEGCRAVDPVARLSYEVHRAPANDDTRAASAPRPSAFPAASRPSVPTPSAAPPQTIVGPAQSAPAAPIAPTPPRVEPAALPSQIVFKREQDATEALPLTYREYVYVVPPGTPDAAAATLAQTQLELVRASLERAPAGKLVNLAVFDATFQGKPTVPPLATITWKDWRGAALLSFPRQPGRAPIPIIAPMSSAQPPSTAAAPAISMLGFIPQTVRPPPAAPVASVIPPAPAVPAFAAPPAVAPVVPNPFAPPSAAPAPNPFALAAPTPSTAPPAVAPVVPNPFAPPSAAPAPNPFAPIAAAPAPLPAAAFAAPDAHAAQPAESGAPAGAFPPSLSSAPFASAPAPMAGPAAAVLSPSVPVAAFVPIEVFAPAPVVGSRAPGPTPSKSPGRIHGEDLIADLFESMHDLHFSRDAVEGGDFCLTLAMEKIPSLAGIIQLYDIDRREFLVTSARGAGTSKLLLRRFPESDELLAAAMRRRRAVVIGDAAQNEAAQGERYAALGGAWSLIVAPVMQAGRFLGAIELLNPIDGEPFTESDGNAVTYIAEQLAEFVAARGIVTDPERISMRPAQ